VRVPFVDEWSAGGDPADGSGYITVRRVAAHWWLMDRWLGYGHPHWEWWNRAWTRLLPYWGDPFCAAYTVAWSRLYWEHTDEGTRIEVGWDALPEHTRADIAARLGADG
jgi:hypothetical protein